MSRLTHSVLSSGLLIAGLALGHAQNLPITISASPRERRQAGGIESQDAGAIARGSSGKEVGFQFVGAEPAVSTKVVKGVPYSLEATLETEQTLADGNRIVHHQVVHVYRDAEGRTRREETLSAIGPWAASGTPPTIVTIQDPVSGMTYSLDPADKIATKLPKGLPGQVTTFTGAQMSGGGIAISAAPEAGKPSSPVTAFTNSDNGAGVVVQDGMASPMEKPDESSEPIGEEIVAGVSAEGMRLTTTIPAEAMGNERPIQITRERWFSPELQIVLKSKQSDPRFGITTYEVTKLDRANPPHSLFEVPRDYHVRKAPEAPAPSAPPK